MSVSENLVYDPLAVFLGVFSDPDFAADLAPFMTCQEINVLVGLLESGGTHPVTLWLAHHLSACDDPPQHLH